MDQRSSVDFHVNVEHVEFHGIPVIICHLFFSSIFSSFYHFSGRFSALRDAGETRTSGGKDRRGACGA